MYVTKIQLFPNIVNFDNRSTTILHIIVDAFSLIFFIEKQIRLQSCHTIPYLVLFHVTHNTSSPNILFISISAFGIFASHFGKHSSHSLLPR